MASSSRNSPATDNASTLRDLVGDDTTATFEDDPKFIDSNPTDTASSENLSAAADDEPDEDDLEDDDDELEDDDEDDVEEGVDEDDLEDEDDELEDDDDDDAEEEDDAEETGRGPALRVVSPAVTAGL